MVVIQFLLDLIMILIIRDAGWVLPAPAKSRGGRDGIRISLSALPHCHSLGELKLEFATIVRLKISYIAK